MGGLTFTGLASAPGEVDDAGVVVLFAVVLVCGRDDGRRRAQLSFKYSKVEGTPDMLGGRGRGELERQGTVAVPAVGDFGCGDFVGA